MSAPEIRVLSPGEAVALENLITALDLKQIRVWSFCGKRRVAVGIGLVKNAIAEMARLATAAEEISPYIEAECNGITVRAYAHDDGEALGEAWWTRMTPKYDDSEIVTLRRIARATEVVKWPTPPRNNDGRSKCFWCGKPTREIELAFSTGNVCTACGR